MIGKVSFGVFLAATAMTLGSGVAVAQPVHTASVSPMNCTLHAKGHQSTVGTLPQARWTEVFSNNCADVRVRARVICEDNFDGEHHTEYGKTINGNGSSYYTCNAVQDVSSGNGQYYNGVKWINLSS